ncbi:MAG: hypothetical protein WA709_38945, partial [Stellaceae bacterium]
TVRDARTEIEDLLETSPSLRHEIYAVVRRPGTSAAKLAAHDLEDRGLEDHGEPVDAVWARLEKGGFTTEQAIGWFPDTAR